MSTWQAQLALLAGLLYACTPYPAGSRPPTVGAPKCIALGQGPFHKSALRMRGGASGTAEEASQLPHEPKTWGLAHVLEFLETLRPIFRDRTDQYRELFSENDIDGLVLLGLTADKLEKARAANEPRHRFALQALLRVHSRVHSRVHGWESLLTCAAGGDQEPGTSRASGVCHSRAKGKLVCEHRPR